MHILLKEDPPANELVLAVVQSIVIEDKDDLLRHHVRVHLGHVCLSQAHQHVLRREGLQDGEPSLHPLTDEGGVSDMRTAPTSQM